MITTADSLTLLNVNMSNVTKLTDLNFLMWSRQVHSLLDGYGLVGYIDGSLPAPSPTITTAETTTENREYVKWKRQDKLIYSALLGAISVNVQPILSTIHTSAAAWEKLVDTYAKPSRSHILQLRQQIKHWKKGTMSISEYVRGFTTRFDQLALLGAPYTHEDQIDFVLEGLPDDYKQVLDQISSRDKAPSLTELHEKLIKHDLKLQAQAVDSSSLPITANAVNYRGNGGNKNNNGSNYRGQQQRFNNKSNQPWQQNQQFRPRNEQYSSVRVAIKVNVKFVVFLAIALDVARSCRYPVAQCHLRVSTRRLQCHGNPVQTWLRHPHLTIQTRGFLIVEQHIISPPT